ncbi:MAG: tetratricopeptide repeat protein [Wenzhouxiangellaceae bacterium]
MELAKRIIIHPAAWVAALLLATLLAYLPSFDARFFLDDFRIILENPLLQDVSDIASIWHFSEARFIASLTFAANYTLHGESVFGFHLVNFLIHAIAGIGLFWLIRGLLQTPALAAGDPAMLRWVAWIAVAIFLLHPLQTQAITYIVQRYTSLMAMFYLASMAAFVWARLRGSIPLYGLALACLALAALSKQTAATLPLALLLIELVFFRRLSPRAWGATLAAAAGLAIAGAWLLTLPAFDIAGLTRETDQISRLDYLATQMEVLWRYIGLFLLIGEQRLEYDIATAQGFSAAATVFMGLGHAAVMAVAAAFWRKLPLVTFGVFFYYLAHLIESGFLPIIDVAFEHRTYLPNAGLALIAGLAMSVMARGVSRYRAGVAAVILILVLLATLTHARNSLWADRIAFLENETRVTPRSQRAWTSLGKELMRDGKFSDALEALEKATENAERYEGGALRPPTMVNMIFALHYTERNREAIELAMEVPVEELNNTEQAFYYEARGRAYLGLGEYNRARDDLERSARLNPTVNAMSYLAVAEFQLGNRARARNLARQVIQVAPDNPLAGEIMQRTQ